MLLDSIRHICTELDIEMPVILKKHTNEIMNFNLIKFYPADFIEKVDFQRFDIEIFIEKDNDKVRN